MMKLVIMVFRESLTDEVHEILKTQDVKAFSEILSVQGTGAAGRVLGTLAWPGHNSMVLVALPDHQAKEIAAEFALVRNRLQEAQHGADIPMKLFLLPVEEAI